MKSFFSKIGTLLLCGVAVAMVGCNDLQEDINKAQNDISAVTVTVEDLQSALAALEAEQEKMAADYAKKAEVEAAKTALQQQLATEKAAIETAISAINTALAQTASKQDVTALQTALTALTTELQSKSKAIEDALALKADKTDVQKVATDLATLQGQYEALTAVLAGKAEKAQVEAVAADLAKLQKSYDETAAVVATLNTKVAEHTGTIASLTDFASQAMLLLTNHEGSINNMVERLATVEGQVKKLIDDCAQAIADLQTLSAAIEENDATDEEQAAAIVALQDAQALLSQEVTAFKATYADQVAQFKAQILALQDAVAEHTEGIQNIKDELDTKIAELEDALDAYTAKYDSAIAEINQMLANKVDNAIFEATIANLADELAKVAAFKADIDKLLARVQSLVYVPEWEDGKADILYGILDDPNVTTAAGTDRFVVSHLSTFKYKVNADNAADLASELAKAKDYFKFEVKTVKTRANEEVLPELEIVNVKAEGGHLLFDVHFRNFSEKFFDGKNMYSTALMLADGNNNVTTEFANLKAVKVDDLTPVVVPGDEKHEIAYDNAGHQVYLLKDNKLVFVNGNGGKLTDARVAKYDLNIKRHLSGKVNGTTVIRQEVSGAQSIFVGDKRLCKVGYNAEENDFTFTLGEGLTKEFKGNEYTFFVNYTVNGIVVKGKSVVELTAKQISYDIPAVEVPWTVAVAEELRENNDLYVKTLVRTTPEYAVPANFEGYTLHSIVQTGNTVKREVSINGVAQTAVDIQASIDEKTVELRLSKGYEFPEYDAENEWNEYKITWVKDHESVRATVTATIKLGRKPAPVVINMPDAKLQLIGNHTFYSANVDFAAAAFKEFAKFSGHLSIAEAKASFEEAFIVADPSGAPDAEDNLVKVNDVAGTRNNVSYKDGIIRLYHNNKIIDGTQVYYSEVNNLWFGVQFIFKVNATLDVPAYLLAYSEADYVVNHDNAKTVFVDARLIANANNEMVYTVSKSDLGKYFTVTPDVDNNNGLSVVFEIKTAGAPKTFNTTVNPAVENDEVGLTWDANINRYALDKNSAVIVDWTNNQTFFENKINVEAVLYANGTFELDRKPLVLYAVDPLTYTVAETGATEDKPIRVERKTFSNAYASPFKALSLYSRVEKELVSATATDMTDLFGTKDPKITYGAEITHSIKRVYYKVDGEKYTYETSKYYYDTVTGVLTLWGDEAVLNTSIFAEIEYELSDHRFNEKEDLKKSVFVEFYPSK